jgi:putative glutamine amidotransferase
VNKPPIVAVTATSELGRRYQEIRVHRAYTDAILAAGLVQGLVLTGGEDIDPSYFGEERHPATGPANDLRDECELAMARAAAARRLPTLAICRGVQVLNVALGGTLVQDIPSQVGTALDHDAESARSTRVHEVQFTRGSRIAGIVNAERITTNSFHHQSVGRLAKGLETVGTSPDGIIEAVECSDRAWWSVGVQWHPEELTATPEDWDRRLFSAFADAVRMGSRPS